MSLTVFVLAGFSAVLFLTVLFLILRQSRLAKSGQDGQSQFVGLAQQLATLTQQLGDKLNQTADRSVETTKQINDRLDNAARLFGDLQKRLGQLAEANDKIYHVGKDISSLQEILKRPKARGSLGEFFLADVLGAMLPQDRFQLQFRFANNEQVDAILRIGDRLLSIDSKFPLENFQRMIEAKEDAAKLSSKRLFRTDVKRHIDSIARKYIQPDQSTFDFALMYIAAENIFYEVISQDGETGSEESLQEYALKKRVFPVSPNSFYAYLMALMGALRGEKMQKNVMDLVSQIRHLAVDLGKFCDDFDKMGHHLGNLRSSYESSEKRLNRYRERLEALDQLPSQEEREVTVKLVGQRD